MFGTAPIDGETRDDAVDVLTDLLEWQLVEERWEGVDAILRSLTEALAAGDGAALRNATAELELAGPIRITRIGAEPLIPAPDRTRDRANRLVHALGSQPPKPRDDGPADDAEGDDDAACMRTR
ncbi:CATRA system-associated protein [Streptomyces adustus]